MKKILIISLAAITLLSTGCSKKHTQSQLPAEESIEIIYWGTNVEKSVHKSNCWQCEIHKKPL